MNDFLIPANFEDSGKIMGFFSTRNVVEAVILADPLSIFVRTWWQWRKNRKILEYRGEVT